MIGLMPTLAQQAEQEKKIETSPPQIAIDNTRLEGEYQYRPEGRRDPFLSQLNQGGDQERRGIAGLQGLMIDELNLSGIIKTPSGFIALVIGPDSKPYNIKLGDKVYDGEVIALDANIIQFKKTATILIPGQKEKIVTKMLNPEKEDL